MITIQLTEAEASHLHAALGQVAGFTQLRTQLESKLTPSTSRRCQVCRQAQGSERAYVGHLIEMHHYRDDPYGEHEDTAQTNAYDVFH